MDQITEPRPAAGARDAQISQTGNFLLQNLSPDDFALLRPHLTRVRFAVGDQMAQAGARIEHVYFPEAAVAGILDPIDEDHCLAVALVGQEGFLGWPILLGDDRSPYDVVMRAEDGEALHMTADALREATAASATLRASLLRFVNVLMIQMGRTTASSLIHSVERRMARWILLYHDRIQAEEIAMTHEEFRLMLGVRRSSITDALHRLEEEHAVRTSRGKVIVRSRAKLLELAGETYGRPEREYRRLIIDAR